MPVFTYIFKSEEKRSTWEERVGNALGNTGGN